MRCAACGADNRTGRRFCAHCGGRLARACAACGAALEEGDRFCGDCGSPVATDAGRELSGGAAPAAPRAAPVAERRVVSVLFADLVGFTALSDQRDSEEVRDLLSQYFATARTVIGRYSGNVEKFIGDAVMAVWGVPSAHEDDAERAVRAALELVDAVSAFGEQVGAPGLQARAAVLTGEAAVNLGAVGEGMVAGDLVNTASRIQAIAEPGAVLVGESTRRASEASIDYEDAGAHELRGKPEPVALWRAGRVVAGRAGSLRPSELEPPFVGRDHELRLLKEFLHATSAEGRARLLSVVGVAGVGKSRLSWELEKYIDGLTEGVWWHRGRCLAYGDGVAFWALTEMVRMRTGIVENEQPSEARQKLRQAVEDFIEADEDRRWVEPRLAQLLGLEDRVAGDPIDLYSAWRFFFERIAARELTVLVFEDLQWADPGLFDFIEYLLEWSRNSRIFVLTLSRPEINERRPGWGSGKRGMTSLYLEPLSDDSMHALLTGLAPGLPEELLQRILAQAAGIPLYAVETVRMLLDKGLLLQEGGAFTVSGSLEALEVPESLHAMIAARLDSLPPDRRRLLQHAAVLGKSFTAAALAAVVGLPAEDVQRPLAEFVDKDLLVIEADPRSPERGQYAFVQDLVRSVAYGTLARRERKSLHVAAATYLSDARTDEDEIAEVIAAHLIEAYQTDPAAEDAPRLRQLALRALVKAGDRAASLAVSGSAQRYYEQALELADDDETRADLSSRAGVMASRQGHIEAARSHLTEALNIWNSLGNVESAARAAVQLARREVQIGFVDMATARLQDAKRCLSEGAERSLERSTAMAEVAGSLGTMRYFVGDMDGALDNLEQSLQIAEANGLHEIIVDSLDRKAWILAAQGRRAETEILQEGALRLARLHGLHSVAPRVETNLAETLHETDRLAAALEHMEQAEELGHRLGDRNVATYSYLARLAPLLEVGRWDECADLYARYTTQDEAELGGQLPLTSLALSAVWLHVRRGDLETARKQVDGATPLFEREGMAIAIELRGMLDCARAVLWNGAAEHVGALETAEAALRVSRGFPTVSRRALVEAVDAAFGLGQDEKVADLLQVAREHFRPGSQPTVDGHMSRWEARLSAVRGETEDAERGFRAAIDAFSALPRPFWEAVTRWEYAEWLSTTDRVAEAEAERSAARATFEALRATPWVERSIASSQDVRAIAR